MVEHGCSNTHQATSYFFVVERVALAVNFFQLLSQHCLVGNGSLREWFEFAAQHFVEFDISSLRQQYLAWAGAVQGKCLHCC